MITALRVRNVQSLSDVSIDMGSVTVIVGPSNSGKSAIIRALRLLTLSGKATGLLRQGESGIWVAAAVDGHRIAAKRGGGTSVYVLDEEQFPKAGTSGPPSEIDKILGITDTNFAEQFDKPFLLDEPASAVAATIGALTRIDLVLDAAREANKRILNLNSTLKVHRGELEKMEENIATLLPARDRAKLLEEATYALSDHDSAIFEADRLRDLIDRFDGALNALKSLPRPPDIEAAAQALAEAERLAEEGTNLNARARALEDVATMLNTEAAKLAATAVTLDDLESQHSQLLKEAGTCPTCGQPTK